MVVLPLRHNSLEAFATQEELAALEELNSAMKSGGAGGTQSVWRGWRSSFVKAVFQHLRCVVVIHGVSVSCF